MIKKSKGELMSRRPILIPLLLLAATTISCSLFTGTANQPSGANLQPTAAAESPSAAPTAAAEPTQVPPTELSPTEMEPTAMEQASVTPMVSLPTTLPTETGPEPTATLDGPITYTEAFDRDNGDWSDLSVITTQAQGRSPYIQSVIDNEVMRISISDKETYVYRHFLYTVDGDVSVEVSYNIHSTLTSGIAVVCKADEDLKNWYEVRLFPGESNAIFYRYDRSIKEEQNKNPYVQIGKVHMAPKEFSPAKPNTIKLTCTDQALTLDVNQGKKVASQPIDTPLPGKLIGLGVMSYNEVPVTIDFDTVTITEEP
jgi:hypothetical protein